MRVVVPSQLYSYTGGQGSGGAAGATLAEVLADLDRQFPGIRFRIIDEHQRVRRHIKMFVNRDQADDNLATPLKDGDEIMIVAALTGG